MKHWRLINSRPVATVVTLLIFVFVVRLIVAGFIIPPQPGWENAKKADRWGEIARNLVEGYGYSYPYLGGENPPEEGGLTAYRTPVPVLFFAGLYWLFGYKLWPIIISNWLFDAATAYILYRIARELLPKRPLVAYLTIIFWALYIPAIFYTNQALSEPIFTFLLSCHIWTILKLQQKPTWSMAILSGVLLGAASLTRPILLAFIPIVWLLLLLSKGIGKQIFDFKWLIKIVPVAVVLTGAFGLTLLPWIARNYLVFNAFIPATHSAGNNLVWDHYYLDTDDYLRQLRPQRVIWATLEKDLQAQGETLVGKSPLELDNVKKEVALEKIKAYPDRYLILSGYRFLRLWFNVGYGVSPSTISLMIMVANGIFLSLAIASLVWFRGEWVQKSLPVLIIPVYITLIHVPLHAQIRYIFPAMPFVMMIASYTLIRIIEGLSSSPTFMKIFYQKENTVLPS